ncbi:MAG: terminase [Phycisphaerae bacterium]|nr:terminase [Phycisphaerae bacterium]
MARPDFSNYVVHFTKDAAPFGANDSPDDVAIKNVTGLATAYDRLVKMLTDEKVIATPMPWTGKHAVALTECPWGSLVDHASRYSPYGIGFTKSHVFASGGGPAVYMRPDLFTKQMDYCHKSNPTWSGFHPHLYAFVTPFAPPYAPASYLSQHWKDKNPIDYTHDREWRVPHDFTFRLDQIGFVVVDTYEDMAKLPKPLKDAIGRDKFLIMDVYRQIENLWPTHIL